MTRDEAIKMLQVTRLMLMDGANQPISDLYYALDMAIEALEQTENSSEKPNNCKDESQTVDLGNGFSITANDCDTCKHRDKPFDDLPCDMCCKAHSGYEPKDEPQTERSE